jgi:hypothetical protein
MNKHKYQSLQSLSNIKLTALQKPNAPVAVPIIRSHQRVSSINVKRAPATLTTIPDSSFVLNRGGKSAGRGSTN